MKLSRAEWAAIALVGAFLAFFTGWYVRGSAARGQYTVTPQHAPVSPAALPSDPVPDRQVDLNAATPDELMTLPGIGEARARDILDYRAAHGPFRSPEELMDVPGIGPAVFHGLEAYITVTEEEADPHEDPGG